MAEIISKYTIKFKEKGKSKTVLSALTSLCVDDYFKVYDEFINSNGKQLLTDAIEGLIVFLSCQQYGETLRGSFASTSLQADKDNLMGFVQHFDSAAAIDFEDLYDDQTNTNLLNFA